MISINDLSVSFGGYTLLDNINFHISDSEHVALVGKNGAGKSTIMKLIMKQQMPTSGSIMHPKDMTIGYLPQIMNYSKDKTIIDDTMLVFSEIDALNDRLKVINTQLSERTDYESKEYQNLIIELNDITDKLSISGTEDARPTAEKTLLGLGFKRSDFNKLRSTFSQGWNMRVELAKVLLRKPDMLMLDEPTNHLDIESIQWLEDYLKSYGSSILLISHDRRFLDSVTTRTVEIVLGKIYDYKASYSKYLALRKERMDQQRAAYENQQRMIEKNEEFINKFRYKATKSNQVQSRIKALDKLDRIEIDIEDTEAMNVKFPPAPRSGQVVFKTVDMVGGYPQKRVFSDANIVVERGEKVAFVGKNGEGKSTMMKILTGDLTPLEGSADLGYNVALGYYAQNQEDILNMNETVYDTLDKIAVGDIRTKLRDILAAFLFKNEDIDKKVSVLSGGERARLAMAKLILKPYNLLALDEPTNHMDIKSKDILKQALNMYDGTLIIVSHDRDFLKGLVDKVYEFRDGRIKEHMGGIDAFLRDRKLEDLQLLNTSVTSSLAAEKSAEASIAVKKEKKKPQKTTPKKVEVKLSFEEQKELRRKQSVVKKLEKEMEKLENGIKDIEKKLATPEKNTDIDKLTREYLEMKRMYDDKMSLWMSASEELENNN